MSDSKISEDEKALFRQAMKTVIPLGDNKKTALPQKKDWPIQNATKVEGNSPSSVLSIFNLSNYSQEEVQAQTILSFCKPSIPNRQFRALKAGTPRWEKRLDMHSMNIEAAKEALLTFILKQYHEDRRCVLVIHGKGSHHGEPPILKNLVNHWLKQLPEVLAFHSAQAQDGGSGALYVLLKRIKEKR